MKPIEEGCLAIVIGSGVNENNGICVTVGKFLGKKKNFRAERLWEVDKPLVYRIFFQGDFICFSKESVCPEKNLLRIDDDFDIDLEEIDEKLLDRELVEA